MRWLQLLEVPFFFLLNSKMFFMCYFHFFMCIFPKFCVRFPLFFTKLTKKFLCAITTFLCVISIIFVCISSTADNLIRVCRVFIGIIDGASINRIMFIIRLNICHSYPGFYFTVDSAQYINCKLNYNTFLLLTTFKNP